MELRKIELNMSEIYSEIGLKPPGALGHEAADKGLRAAGSYTAKQAAQGDQMAAIQHGGNRIAAIAASESRGETLALGVSVMPTKLVHMQVRNSDRIDIFA
ncbi:MAG: DUF6470 family protein [Candidatus Wallbacteria bacterium]|nr:DUF6470 family protein [Candidatus Wallbacteria bacterium]